MLLYNSSGYPFSALSTTTAPAAVVCMSVQRVFSLCGTRRQRRTGVDRRDVLGRTIGVWRSNSLHRSSSYAVPHVCQLLVRAYSRVRWCACHAPAVLLCSVCVQWMLLWVVLLCCRAGFKNGGFPQQIALLFYSTSASRLSNVHAQANL